MSDAIICITKGVKLAIEKHACDEQPLECCGLLSGTNEVIVAAHPLRNLAERPETRYFASPEDLFAAMRRIREAGERMLGIYHSHPRTTAYPSPADIEMAFYPEAVYFIISLEPQMDLRAFKIKEARIEEVTIAMVE